MILVDTAIWVDHFRKSDATLVALLNGFRVLGHPFVVGELALGNLRNRAGILQMLGDLPQAVPANDMEVLIWIDRHKLYGLGIGYVDAHLLASASLSSARLWTRDKKLQDVALKLKLAYSI